MTTLLYTLCFLPTTMATIGVGLSPGGVTELFGNSFGQPGVNATYDYIVVGGGTAGNAIAARLALDPANYSVAVVEAGSFYEILNSNRTQVPGYDFYSALANFVGGSLESLTNFGLQTAPQGGYNGREIMYVAGQTFGGSSASNYMGYARATVGTFDEWSKVVGDDFWSWDNVYPAYKKSCNFTPPNYDKIDPSFNISYDASAFESGRGPLQVSYGNYLGPYGPYLEESLDKLGFERIPGLNSGRLIGYATITAAIDPKQATRSSSETSFLQLAAQNSKIKLYPQTMGSRILFDGNKRATGVEVQTNSLMANFKYHLNANKEVIVSAGTWHSPQILLLSGIGPSETLQKYNIPVVVDLPGVGQGARDQPWMALSYKVNVTTGTQVAAGNAEFSAARVEEYLYNQTGLLSSIGGGQALAFEKFPESYHWPEVNYLSLEYGSYPSDLGPNDNYLTIGSALLTTSARGNLTIQSADIADPPIISPNWLLDEGDQEQAIAALQRIREIAFNSTIVEEEYLPGPNVTTRSEILEWLKNNMSLIYHATSSCKMGASDDTTAVVDSRARVRGVTGLRVVDASAFPFVPPGFPMATVYMFAEKIAESILDGQ
ncbi:GMC family oxidoreductase [Aspergillus novofumigatus IBT 16806]|uniref:Oxidoreductase n=1 Tax=Aspergillus novofumigatus (strain IBT 16806) TaxID=1392255 RepID=A0A2I1BX50_ASPN1|nr:oxidoreductase [Aspergillus novofumigatus IBT 16806]PKX89959.1 oxidoreductase [Aspergillus novofumigatus IBT 16806]